MAVVCGTDEAARCILSGGIVVYPTETVYGMGANALDERSIARVYEIKRRPLDKPISIAVSSFEMLCEVADVRPEDLDVMRRLLPGPVTFLVRKRSIVPDMLTAGSPLVGVRYPDHEIALRLIEMTGPITSTSANITGAPPPSDPEDIDPEILSRVDMLIDGGRCRYAVPSTLVDLSSRRILRMGAMADRVLEVIGDESQNQGLS
ncbi:MAG TPA: L-threonylcarbamoyladenylate synthase [Methanothrix sp.]|nr:L-threonylcarbamoyladenylate synthase [Methanothrix sp.]HOK57549.1 L-threonylcarbamoyladenylate synthase [Methanothrix sp.]HOL42913.1 L-threonylcarbamoyladenylate synthase [Methanothrix sp.]HPO87834.1 L-threonylcarbamoyladenylate synthase [Methanothrix sp.]